MKGFHLSLVCGMCVFMSALCRRLIKVVFQIGLVFVCDVFD